jgi:predicted RNase H-like HicB family nuclease
MTCTVILTPQNGRYRARVAELPECQVVAKGRAEALILIEKRIQEIVKRSEIVQVEIPRAAAPSKPSRRNAAKQPDLVKLNAPIAAEDDSVHLETPWDYYGLFKDDPTWQPMLDQIERRRDRQKVYPIKRKK